MQSAGEPDDLALAQDIRRLAWPDHGIGETSWHALLIVAKWKPRHVAQGVELWGRPRGWS